MVGGPDMAKKRVLLFFQRRFNSFSNFMDKTKLKVYFSSHASLNNNPNNLSSYLAGLFEGDGHV
jgi:hypothetical protein